MLRRARLSLPRVAKNFQRKRTAPKRAPPTPPGGAPHAHPLALQSPLPFTELLQHVRAGQSDARDELFARVYPAVGPMVHRSLSRDVRRGRSWLQARFSTGDIVQEVCRAAFASLDAFAGETQEDFEAFLATLVRNRIIDAIRFHEAEQRDGRRSSGTDVDEEARIDEASPDEVASSREIDEEFRRALEIFPEREQILLRARLENTLSFAELTRILGYSSVTTAKRAFAEGRARLAARMALRLEGVDR